MAAGEDDSQVVADSAAAPAPPARTGSLSDRDNDSPGSSSEEDRSLERQPIERTVSGVSDKGRVDPLAQTRYAPQRIVSKAPLRNSAAMEPHYMVQKLVGLVNRASPCHCSQQKYTDGWKEKNVLSDRPLRSRPEVYCDECQHCTLSCSCCWKDPIMELLSMKVNINASTRGGDTPLLVAVRQGQVRLVALLLRAKADITSSADKRRWTPLHEAAREGRTKVCAVLLKEAQKLSSTGLEEDRNMNSSSSASSFVESFSSQPSNSRQQARKSFGHRDFKTVAQCWEELKHDAELPAKDLGHTIEALCRCRRKPSLILTEVRAFLTRHQLEYSTEYMCELLDTLQGPGVEVDQSILLGIIACCGGGKESTMGVNLNMRLSHDTQAGRRRTRSHSIAHESASVVPTPSDLVNARCAKGEESTPFLEAAGKFAAADIVKEMLRYRANVDLALDNGTTALMRAAENGDAATCQVLIDGGAYLCAGGGDVPGCRGNCLLDWHRPRINQVHQSALSLARGLTREHPRYEACVKLLQKYGVK
eukprot:gnl/TRDRNA2_/TRDRNA2_136706_c0_seq4.p1 gnl/TRDRNA2_/TRDRNA2_136706_c0~~gnl/TRDRNA2_/TRDRNA2_136706_c0_seq4.p1  ORF type:complete len:534 (+),score=73.15 gnl/TRDRNA2_/TRDRNA2_136706_c0_seq4:109-1710(+)